MFFSSLGTGGFGAGGPGTGAGQGPGTGYTPGGQWFFFAVPLV